MMDYYQIDSAEALRAYLREFTARYDERKNSFFLSHYSSIMKVINLLNSGFLWLGDYRQMNDPFETQIINKSEFARKLFFTSFSMAEESLAMYKMYGGHNPDSLVILQLSVDILESIMSYSHYGERVNGIDDDGEFDQHLRKLQIVRNGVVSENLMDASVYAAEVAYVDPISGMVYVGNKENNCIVSPLKSKKMAGLIKYKCWEYEQEVRLCAYSSDFLENDEILAIKLPNDFCKHVKVILGPGFDMNKYRDELFELRLLGVVFQNSIYEGYYTDITRGRIGSYSFSQKLYINDYLNKTYKGVDPWGEELLFEITKYNDNMIIWNWKNCIMVGEERVIIDIDGVSYGDNELTFNYEFVEKKTISDDPNEYLYYSYRGGILLAGNKVYISFNGGNCFSYAFGGSGVDNYSESGSWRNGNNLLAVLEQR